MSGRRPRDLLATELEDAAASYQAAHIVNHCTVCSKPCCKLETLVLELKWKQVKVFWNIEESRAEFDRRLASGKGPSEIRAGDDGLYYAHQKPCPAYDETQRNCKVYGQALKPVGCTDFPVYGDGDCDCVIADLRCEAVDMDALRAWIARAVGPEFRIVESANPDFPFLISLTVRRRSGGQKPRTRRG